MDRLIINGFMYLITNTISELPIALAKKIDELVPADSWYRNPKGDAVYNEVFAKKVIGMLSNVPGEVLDKCNNIRGVYEKFCHELLINLYNPQEVKTELKKPLKLPIDIYENETIFAFASASQLLLNNEPIQIADYFCAVYIRKGEYEERQSLANVPMFNTLPFDLFVQCLILHNEASEKVRQYHSKLFENSGESNKDLVSLISTVAEKGVFNTKDKTPLEAAREVTVSSFFDYVETLV